MKINHLATLLVSTLFGSKFPTALFLIEQAPREINRVFFVSKILQKELKTFFSFSSEVCVAFVTFITKHGS
jgi:hypothetical protein